MALPLLRVEENPCVYLARYHAVDRQACQIVYKSQHLWLGIQASPFEADRVA